MSEVNRSGGFHYGFLIVFAGCVLTLFAVSLTYSCAGVFFAPVGEELGVGRAAIGLYLSITALCATITLPFAGRILSKYNIRWIVSFFVVVLGAMFFVMSRATSIYYFYVAAVGLGVSQGFILYLTVPTLINRWFKVRVGFFIGLCSAMSGVGGIIFNPVAGYIIQNYGWRTGYMTFTAAMLLICLPVVAIFIRSDPSEKGVQPYGAEEAAAAAAAAGNVAVTGVSVGIVMKSIVFPVMLLFSFCIAFVTNVNFYLPGYANSFGHAATIAGSVGSASMFGVMLGKIGLGWINDRSVKAGIITCCGAGIIGMLMMMIFGSQGVWALVGGAFFYGISYAGVNVQTPMLVRSVVGNRDYAQIYANVAIAASFSSTIGGVAWGLIIDKSSFATMFMIGCALLAAAFMLGFYALQIARKFKHTES